MEKEYKQKQLLFEAVMNTVNSHGFHGSSMAMIAKNAQINTSNIYHYFCSKDVLISETFNYVRNMVDAYVFQEQRFEHCQSYFEEFKIVFTYYVEFYKKKSVYLSFMEQFGKSPYFKQLILISNNEQNGKITQFLTKGIDTNVFNTRDIRCIKTLLFGAINELTYHLFSTENKHNTTQIEHCIVMLWNALTMPINTKN